jgi:hypothetical protein
LSRFMINFFRCVLGLFFFAFFSQCSTEDANRVPDDKSDSSVEFIRIGKMIVSPEEFLFHMSQKRATIFSLFSKTYGAEFSREFWTTNYGGITPLDSAKKLTLDVLVRIKCAQQLAGDLGVPVEPDYKTMVSAMQRINANREQAVLKKKVIYGPIKYSSKTYFGYLYSNMEIKIKDKLLTLETQRNNLNIGPPALPKNKNDSGLSAMEKSHQRYDAMRVTYEQILDSLVEHSDVVINQVAYNALQMQ